MSTIDALRVPLAKSPMTADEFWEFVHRPENENLSFELIRGEVVEVSRPTKPHCAVAANITRLLGNYSFQVERGYVLSNDSGVVLSAVNSVVGPDVAYYLDANIFDELHPKWGELPPILAVEVLSPNDKPSQVNAKIEDYLRCGVKLVWLVDYEAKVVTVYRPDSTHQVVKETGELTGGEALPGLTCRVADFFRLPGDRTPAPPLPTVS